MDLPRQVSSGQPLHPAIWAKLLLSLSALRNSEVVIFLTIGRNRNFKCDDVMLWWMTK